MPTKELMFHGTSSVNCKSILKNGLVCHTDHKIYKTIGKTSLEQPSLKSLDGVYFSSSFFMPSLAGAMGAYKLGGHPLYVISEIDMNEAVPDEDQIRPHLESSFSSCIAHFLKVSLENVFSCKERWASYFGYIDSSSSHKVQESHFLFNELYKKIDIEDMCDGAYKEYIFSSVSERIKAHLFSENKNNYIAKYTSHHKEFRTPPIPLSTHEAEESYLSMLDSLCKKCQCFVYKNNKDKRIRVPKTVGFLGSSKIISIYSYKDNKLILRYGKEIDLTHTDFIDRHAKPVEPVRTIVSHQSS